ncbi:CDP-glucose 4,6-dehydratase [Paenibacillus psychroresistens]|nr:CDP-glucose 4,6-dehydratase [Paenibacillus psychroresistens]
MENRKSSMEKLDMMSREQFWQGKKVFVTGHTGFKGSWLCLWLNKLGAEVTGYALQPPTKPSLFEITKLSTKMNSIIGDIRDAAALNKAMADNSPEIVIHMAAQPLVRESYNTPVETYATNVMGTVNLLEAVRHNPSVKAVVNVTTDKVYENKEWHWGYRENEPLGGLDPYSNSKACSELVTQAYRQSFFANGAAVASARAGNVIGGGDWAADRLIPDCINALLQGEAVRIRNPYSIRPWQHVLEPLSGYLSLAEKLFTNGKPFAESWNFGPDDQDAKPVQWIVEALCAKWGHEIGFTIDEGDHPHEAKFLKLDCSKAKNELQWQPCWSLDTTLDKIVEWSKVYQSQGDMQAICLAQIAAYEAVLNLQN